MMDRHTPAPWALSEGNASAFVYALDETGGVNRFSCLVQGGYTYCGRTGKDRTSEREISANARLISAAPELLSFAQEFVEAWDLGMAGDSSLLDTARGAIAKARGEA